MEKTPDGKHKTHKKYDSDNDSTPPAVMAPRQTITFTLDGIEIK